MADPNESVRALIHSLHRPPNHHSVYLQTRSHPCGLVEHVLMVHKAPGQEFDVPATFNGYAVEVHPWSKPYDGADPVP